VAGQANEPRHAPPGSTADLIGFGWLYGLHARTCIANRDDPMTVNLRKSSNFMRANRDYVKKGWPAAGDISVGHWAAAFESLDNFLIGRWNPTQFQLGGSSGRVSANTDGTVTYTVRNGMTNSSFLAANTIADTFGIGKAGSHDNPYGPTGPKHNVLQVFQWSEPNSCQH
jgi:hypothetical protein